MKPVTVAACLLLAAAGCGPPEIAAVGRSEPATSVVAVDPAPPEAGPSPTVEVEEPAASIEVEAPEGEVPTTSPGTTPPAAAKADPSPAPCGWRAGSGPATYRHVVWIWMENRRFSEVIGNQAAPYETALAAACGTATNFAHTGQPSLPNYIAATSGDTQGIADNGHPLAHPLTVDNIFRQVRAAGGTARTYAEAMPVNCWAGETDDYTFITNPALYYSSLGDAAACLADDVPMGTLTDGALAADIDAGALPTFATVVPDLCNNTHDCPVAAGDAWLARWIPRILGGLDYRTQATAVFVVWDEFTPMPFIVVSPTTRPGTVVTAPLDHYSLLRTTEELLRLPLLARAGLAASMRAAFNL